MIGQILGHYRIIQKIGAGGMGLVYRARDNTLDRDVAIKVLPASVLADEVAHKRFRREALAISKLNHANIGMIFDFGSENGVDYLVMEYVTGTTLAHRLATGALPEKELLDLGIQIASALEEAHERGVVHRDLKPANIMVTPKGLAKVLDFGLAKMIHPCGDTDSTASSSTESHTVVGTYPYMSPEQLRADAVDVRSDIYSFGIVLYEMVTGQPPFRDHIPARLIDAVLNRPPISPSSFKPGILLGLERLILKALDKNPERRYQSARELRVDLQRLLTPSSDSHAVVPALRRRAPKSITSIAILPLVNTSADQDTEHVSDGLTETLTAKLTQLTARHALQVVPAEWMQRSLATHQQVGYAYGPLTRLEYGYLWWLSTVRGHAVRFAWGYRGQFIFVVPDLRLVVVATSALRDAPNALIAPDPDVEAQVVLGLIVDDVLPAVRE